jgi:hypothetical protein
MSGIVRHEIPWGQWHAVKDATPFTTPIRRVFGSATIDPHVHPVEVGAVTDLDSEYVSKLKVDFNKQHELVFLTAGGVQKLVEPHIANAKSAIVLAAIRSNTYSNTFFPHLVEMPFPDGIIWSNRNVLDGYVIDKLKRRRTPGVLDHNIYMRVDFAWIVFGHDAGNKPSGNGRDIQIGSGLRLPDAPAFANGDPSEERGGASRNERSHRCKGLPEHDLGLVVGSQYCLFGGVRSAGVVIQGLCAGLVGVLCVLASFSLFRTFRRLEAIEIPWIALYAASLMGLVWCAGTLITGYVWLPWL